MPKETSKKALPKASKGKFPAGDIVTKSPKGLQNNIFFWVTLCFVGLLITNALFPYDPTLEKKPISEILGMIKNEKIEKVTVSNDRIEVVTKTGEKIVADKETSISFSELLHDSNLTESSIPGGVTVEHPVNFMDALTPFLMLGLPMLVLFIIFRQMKGASNDIFAFSKSKAKLFNQSKSKVTFKDVAGNNEAKTEMIEIVDFLKNPAKYRKLGARTPKGVLLVGPAGVGKTLLAKAIAGEAGVPFFSMAGSEFMEILVGVGSARARDLFEMAKKAQPSLIFIDEIDAIGRQRGMGIGGGHDEREQTLNQILIEMDGFDERTDVIVLAATNRPDMLDPALVRAGRFDRKINIPLPDLSDREAILEIHKSGKPFAEGVQMGNLAKKTVGFSGADLENMLNEAAILAARDNKSTIDEADLEEASIKVTMGSERKTLQTEQERRLTAYHEAGHALVAVMVEDMDPVTRVSIIARGGSLGHTSIVPERDRMNETKTRLTSLIAMMMGGRAAEELVFNEYTTGASSDIERATSVARKMVTEYGMSELGPISFDGHNGNFWLAKDIDSGPHYSEEMSAKIDNEVSKIVHAQYQRALKALKDNRKVLDKMSDVLVQKETIYADEFKKIIDEKDSIN